MQARGFRNDAHNLWLLLLLLHSLPTAPFQSLSTGTTFTTAALAQPTAAQPTAAQPTATLAQPTATLAQPTASDAASDATTKSAPKSATTLVTALATANAAAVAAALATATQPAATVAAAQAACCLWVVLGRSWTIVHRSVSSPWPFMRSILERNDR